MKARFLRELGFFGRKMQNNCNRWRQFGKYFVNLWKQNKRNNHGKGKERRTTLE